MPDTNACLRNKWNNAIKWPSHRGKEQKVVGACTHKQQAKKTKQIKIEQVHETGRRGSKFTFDRLPRTRFSRLSSWRRQISI